MTGNLAHLPHDVTFASFADGKRIEGKLSDGVREMKKMIKEATGKEKITPVAVATESMEDGILRRIAERRKELNLLEPLPVFFSRKLTWLTVTQVSKITKVSDSHLRRMILDKRITKIQRATRGVLITVEEVEFLKQGFPVKRTLEKAEKLKRKADYYKKYYAANKERILAERAEYRNRSIREGVE